MRLWLFLFTADLPVGSPLCHAVLKTLQRWEQVLQKRLEIFGGPPSQYISTHLQDEAATPGPALLRHKALYEPSNTPFRYNHEKGIGTQSIFTTVGLEIELEISLPQDPRSRALFLQLEVFFLLWLFSIGRQH